MLLALLNESDMILPDDIVEAILDKVRLHNPVLCKKLHSNDGGHANELKQIYGQVCAFKHILNNNLFELNQHVMFTEVLTSMSSKAFIYILCFDLVLKSQLINFILAAI